jgi:hypothetical protein
MSGLVALALLGPNALSAADAAPAPAAPVFNVQDVDTPPALVARPNPRPPTQRQPAFGARLRFEVVVDALGRPRDATLVDAQATLLQAERTIQESDLPALQRFGLLRGLPDNASFAEINDLITKPFVESARENLLAGVYRPANKAGAAVTARVSSTVEFRTIDLMPEEGRTSGRANLISNSASPTAAGATPATPPVPAEIAAAAPFTPSAALIATPLGERGSLMLVPGQPPTNVVPVSRSESLIISPNQPQASILRIPNGGSTVITPGQPPTTVVPVSPTERIIFTPGQPQTTVVDTPGGGSTIYTPGQPPTTVVPTGGGSIIYAPGQPPVIVPPNP